MKQAFNLRYLISRQFLFSVVVLWIGQNIIYALSKSCKWKGGMWAQESKIYRGFSRFSVLSGKSRWCPFNTKQAPVLFSDRSTVLPLQCSGCPGTKNEPRIHRGSLKLWKNSALAPRAAALSRRGQRYSFWQNSIFSALGPSMVKNRIPFSQNGRNRMPSLSMWRSSSLARA